MLQKILSSTLDTEKAPLSPFTEKITYFLGEHLYVLLRLREPYCNLRHNLEHSCYILESVKIMQKPTNHDQGKIKTTG